MRIANATPNSGAIATLFSDNLASPTSLANPLTGDSQGNFFFYAEDARYDIAISGGTPSITTFTVADVELADTGGRWNDIRIVDGFQFTNLQAAIDDLVVTNSVGGIVYSNTAETFSTNPFTNVSGQGVTVFLGHATWTADVPIVLPTGCRIIGNGRNSTEIKAGASLSAYTNSDSNARTAVIVLGDTNPNSFGMRVENLIIDCNSVTNCIGIYSESANEQSGAKGVLIRTTPFKGVWVENTTSGTPQNSGAWQDMEILFTSPVAASIGFDIDGASGGQCLGSIDQLTINRSSGSNRIGTGIQVDAVRGCVFSNLHIENCENGMVLGSQGDVFGITIQGVSSGNNMGNSVIQISSSNDVRNLTLIAIQRNTATNVLDDLQNSNKITELELAFYTYSGTNSASALFSTSAQVSNKQIITNAIEGSLPNQPRWIFKQVDFGDMTAASTADTFTLWTFPANTMIHDIVGTVVTGWSGGSISAAVASVGTNAGSANDLTLDDNFFATGTRYELHDATASGGKGTLLFDSTDKFAPHMFVAGGVVELQMDLTSDNHVNATAGRARIYALVSQPLGNTTIEAN